MHHSLLTAPKAPSIATVNRYAYLNTLVSALSERLLSAGELRGLVEQPAADITALLRSAGLEAFSLEEMEDCSLEQMLVTTLLVEAQRLTRPLASEARDLMSYWLGRFEIGNLKAVIRGKLAGRPKHIIQQDFIDVGAMAALPLEDLLEAEDTQEMLRQLGRTPYASIARQARSAQEEGRLQAGGEERQELFLMEAIIDREYFAGLERRVKAIGAPDRATLRPLIGQVIDRNNLVWLLRYRFAYRLPPPLTYFLLCPGGYHLNSQQLLTIVRSESFEEALSNIPAPVGHLVAEAASVSEVEDRLESYLATTAQFILKRTRFNPGRALAYLFLREKELFHIYGVLKGRMLQLTPALIHQAAGLADESDGVSGRAASKSPSDTTIPEA